MKKSREFYEIRNEEDTYGLCGCFETENDALNEINRSYERAKERGYDNRHEKWVIVCNQVIKEYDEKGRFLKEETVRFVMSHAEYSTYENKYAFTY